MNKQIVVYLYNGIILSKEKDKLVKCYNIDEPRKHWAKEHRHKKLYTVWFHLYEFQEQATLIRGDKNQNGLPVGSGNGLEGQEQAKPINGKRDQSSVT